MVHNTWNSIKLGCILLCICLGAAVSLSFIYQLTQPAIAQQEKKQQDEALAVVLPHAVSFSERIEHSIQSYYKGFGSNKELVGYATIGAAKGYSSTISVMVGVNTEFVIERIKILNQQETPGLGERVMEIPADTSIAEKAGSLFKKDPEKQSTASQWPWFQEQFFGVSYDALSFKPEKESGVHAITGATITSRAVLKAVRESIENLKKVIVHGNTE